MGLDYTVKFDEEFKSHILGDILENIEISYSSLSTGQKKSLDLAIIFGILKTLLININFNIIFLDELFSNIDSNNRDIMLSILNESFDDEKSVFIINHAEMSDEYFSHKIRVSLLDKEIFEALKTNEITEINTSKKNKLKNNIIKTTQYKIIF